jgi:phosphate transport system protein
MDGHTLRVFDSELMELRVHLLKLGRRVLEQVREGVSVLIQGRLEIAADVAARKEQIQSDARNLEEEIIVLLAKRQPVASDLRAILLLGRVVTELESVDRAARKIAKRSARIREVGCSELPALVADAAKLSTLALGMLQDALDCFEHLDADSAGAIEQRDEVLDQEFHRVLGLLMTHPQGDEQQLRCTLDTVFVLRALERVGDHAGHIAAIVPRLLQRAAEPAVAPNVGPGA